LKTLNFKVSVVIYCHTSRSTKGNFSLTGSCCYELQSKLCFCYPKVIYKIAKNRPTPTPTFSKFPAPTDPLTKRE